MPDTTITNTIAPELRTASQQPASIVLTDEQENIISRAPEQSLRVIAGAGCAKTTTLENYAKAWPQRGLYLAFNSAIAQEAKHRFPGNILCQTAHAHAYHELGINRYQSRLLTRLGPEHLLPWAHKADVPGVNDRQIGFMIARAITAWCQSDQDDISEDMIPGTNRYAKMKILPIARQAAVDLTDWESTSHPLTHDLYLKRFVIENDVSSAFHYIMVDEAQDLNGVLLQLVRKASRPTLAVGDDYQSIYRFRGALNALDSLRGERLPLTKSWRFGQSVANLANRVLTDHNRRPEMLLQGREDRDSLVLPYANIHIPGACYIARTNAAVFDGIVQLNQPYHMIGGATEMINQVQAAYNLYKNIPSQHKDPIVSRFKTWGELQMASKYEEDPDARRLENIINTYNDAIPQLVIRLRQLHVNDPTKAAAIYGTAHKTKGLEWDRIVIMNDFKTPQDLWSKVSRRMLSIEEYNQEINLIYMAVTRGRYECHITPELFEELSVPTTRV